MADRRRRQAGRVRTIVLGARNVDATREFWEDRLGFDVVESYDRQVVIDAGGVELMFDATGEITPAAAVEIQIRMSRAQFGRWLARLQEAGVPIVRPGRDYGGPLGEEAAFKDPSGYVVVFFVGRR